MFFGEFEGVEVPHHFREASKYHIFSLEGTLAEVEFEGCGVVLHVVLEEGVGHNHFVGVAEEGIDDMVVCLHLFYFNVGNEGDAGKFPHSN